MPEWEADDEGYVLVSSLVDYAFAVAGDKAVLVQLRFAAAAPGAEPDIVQLALTLEQAREFNRALTQTIAELARGTEGGFLRPGELTSDNDD